MIEKVRSASGNVLRLRLTADGAELRCPHCLDWLPLSREFWNNRRWDHCRACTSERWAMLQIIKRKEDEGWAQSERVRARRYRAFLMRTAPEYLPAYERERRARHREWQRGYRERAA